MLLVRFEDSLAVRRPQRKLEKALKSIQAELQNVLATLTDAGLLQRLGTGRDTRYQLIF
jgi:hypothetical protein